MAAGQGDPEEEEEEDASLLACAAVIYLFTLGYRLVLR